MEIESEPRNRRLRVTAMFGLSTLWVFGTAYFAQLLFPAGPALEEGAVAAQWFSNWDSGWYASIVGSGYTYTPGEMSNIVFLPLYPLLTYLVSLTGLPIEAAGVLISNAALLAAVLVFDHAFKDRSACVRDTALVLLLCNPCRVFFSAFYTESLFLLLLLLVFVETQSARDLRASLWAAALGLTRINGFLAAIPIVWRMFTQDRILHPGYWLRRAYVILPGLALVAYFGYLYWEFGDFFAFTDAQRSGWGRGFVFPLFTIDRGMGGPDVKNFFRVLHHGALIISVFAIVAGIRQRFPAGWLILMAAFILLALGSGRMESFARYVSVLFPIYVILAEAVNARPLLRDALILAHGALGTIGILLFTRGYWFT